MFSQLEEERDERSIEFFNELTFRFVRVLNIDSTRELIGKALQGITEHHVCKLV